MKKTKSFFNYFNVSWLKEKEDSSVKIKKYIYKKENKTSESTDLPAHPVIKKIKIKPHPGFSRKDRKYEIRFYGQLKKGISREKAEKKLIQMCKLSPEKVKIMFSKKPAILKSNISNQEAWKVKNSLKNAGIICSLREMKNSKNQDYIKTIIPENVGLSGKNDN